MRLVRSPIGSPARKSRLIVDDPQCVARLQPFHGAQPGIEQVHDDPDVIGSMEAPSVYQLVRALLLIRPVHIPDLHETKESA
jgi:hypothetical protein